jgi:hypothetical protein
MVGIKPVFLVWENFYAFIVSRTNNSRQFWQTREDISWVCVRWLFTQSAASHEMRNDTSSVDKKSDTSLCGRGTACWLVQRVRWPDQYQHEAATPNTHGLLCITLRCKWLQLELWGKSRRNMTKKLLWRGISYSKIFINGSSWTTN